MLIREKSLYVCICNAIKETELRKAAVRHKGSAEEVYATFGRTPQCRQCLEYAETVLADARRAHTLPAIIPA